MTEATAIQAKPRTVIGKSAHLLEPAGQIPAVLYGAGRETVAIALDRHDFELFMAHHEGHGGLVEIELEGESKPVTAMLRQVQTSPVKGTILHVDFQAVRLDKPVQSPVALHFVGESAGVKAGGVFLHELREVNVEALPANLPEFIEVDISGLEVGDTLHVSDIVAPKGVSVLDDGEGIVGSVTTPTVAPTEEEIAAGAEVSEPEVIGESESAE